MKIALLEPLNVPSSLIEELAQPIKDDGHEFMYYDEKTIDLEELKKRSQDADIIMIANNPYPGEVIESAKQLEFINVAFTGFDHVDVETAKAQKIKIANAAGYSDDAVAELVIGLSLDVYRKISEGNQEIRLAEDFSKPFQGRQIKGKKVGIIGTGKIGSQTARLFHAFGADILAYNRSEKDGMKDLGATYVSLDELMEKSDIISLHLPNNQETKGLISKEKLVLMKEDAIFINCARGPIVDNNALAQALNEEKIAGAGIDVFDMEPPIQADYPLLKAKNTVLTPHVAFLTDEAMVARAHIAFENILAYLKGQPKNIVVE